MGKVRLALSSPALDLKGWKGSPGHSPQPGPRLGQRRETTPAHPGAQPRLHPRRHPRAHPAAAEQRTGSKGLRPRTTGRGGGSMCNPRAPGAQPPATTPCGPTPMTGRASPADRLYSEQRVEARHAPRQDLPSYRVPCAPGFPAADSTARSYRGLGRLTLPRVFSTSSPIPRCRFEVCLVLRLRGARTAKWETGTLWRIVDRGDKNTSSWSAPEYGRHFRQQ